MAFTNPVSLKNLSPANFAFVMSTGVVSLIFHRTGWLTLSWIFLIIGTIGYGALVTLFTTRILALKKEVIEDFKDIKKMFKYLTFCAGSNALAVSFCLFGYNHVGLLLGIIGVFSTVFFTYLLFCTLFFISMLPFRTLVLFGSYWLLLAILQVL